MFQITAINKLHFLNGIQNLFLLQTLDFVSNCMFLQTFYKGLNINVWNFRKRSSIYKQEVE